MKNLKNKPTVPEVLLLVKEYYLLPNNSVGGSLHIVLSDGNIEDSDIMYCINYARNKNDTKGVELGELLLRMSKTQRKKLYNSKYY